MLDNIYCINLKEDVTRRELMNTQFKKHNLLDKITYIEARTPESKEVLEDFKNNQKVNITKSETRIKYMSQIAISHSHKECWAQIYKYKLTYGCIIEDDIILQNNFMIKYTNSLTPTIKNIMNTEPCILWLTGLSSLKYVGNNSYTFQILGPQYGNCMYIINWRFARVLLNNFYPIKMPCDDYIKHMVKENNLRNYSMTPPLAYDLSSEYYKKMWTEEDKKTQEKIKRTSTKNPI